MNVPETELPGTMGRVTRETLLLCRRSVLSVVETPSSQDSKTEFRSQKVFWSGLRIDLRLA